MSLLDRIPIWQRHFAIEQAMATLYGFELQFPRAAQMVSSGQVNQRELPAIPKDESADLGKLFEGLFNFEPLPPEQEVENEAWRSFVRLIGSVVAQIYFVSRDRAAAAASESPPLRELRAHGDGAIATIVARSWRSIGRFVPYLFSDPELEIMVGDLVEKQVSIDSEIGQFASAAPEVTNA